MKPLRPLRVGLSLLLGCGLGIGCILAFQAVALQAGALSAEALQAVTVSAAMAQPLTPAAPLACEDGEQATGSVYRICLPDMWNGDLVVYAHGYVAPNRPVGIPEDQFTLEGLGDISQIVTDRDYAFAASSYRTNGLAVQDGIDDLLDVVALFGARYGAPRKVLLIGVSEGALVAALSLERHPDIYDGALAMCGPYGDFQRQINYLGDFRTVFDVFFPNLLPPTAVDIPPALLDSWETETYSTTVRPHLLEPANALSVTQLLTVTGAPFDAEDLTTQEATVERLLWYNVYATNDARARLGGQPYDNATREYRGAQNDAALNTAVARFDADPVALAAIAAAYETRGNLRAPLITLHTSDDPVTPVWHMDAYRAKIEAAGRGAWHEAYRFNRYGHCSFALLEILGAFDRLAEWVETLPAPILYVPTVAHGGADAPARNGANAPARNGADAPAQSRVPD